MDEMANDPVRWNAGAIRAAGLAALLLSCSLPGVAAEALDRTSCSLLLEDASLRWLDGAGRYDPLADRTLYGELEVRVRRGIDDAPPSAGIGTPGATDAAVAAVAAVRTPCVAAVDPTGSGLPALSGPGGELRYEVRDPSRERGRAAIAALLPGDLARVRFEIAVQAGQPVAAGRYAGALDVRLTGVTRVAASTDTPFDHARRVAVAVRVDSAASLDFAGTVTRDTFVDLGTLRTGATTRLPVALSVRSTSPYFLRFSSENGGALQQVRGARVWRVPYSLHVAGERVSLGSREAVLSIGGVSPAGERLSLDFVVGEVENARAGRYTDRVRVEIVPSRL